MCTYFYKETVFLIGLILNITSSILLVILFILCGVQYNYLNINFTKINSYQNLNDFQLSLCIIYVFCCILGFIVFIKHLECKTMQKIYIIYAIISFAYSIVVSVICFLSFPKTIKNKSDLDCQKISPKGILSNFYKLENIFYETDKYLCSDECPCVNDEKIKFQKCPETLKKSVFNQSLLYYTGSEFQEQFNNNKFMKYWERLENKFKCTGFCNNSYFNIEDNNINYINKYLFSNKNNKIKNNGCLFPMSDWFNKMILSYGILVIINTALTIICIYTCFAILFDKVYEGSNYPQYSSRQIKKKISENKQIDIINENHSKKDKSLDIKVTNEK